MSFFATAPVPVVNDFNTNGWLGTFPLLSTQEVRQLTELYEAHQQGYVSGGDMAALSVTETFENRPWYKSLHASIPAFREVACHPDIVSKVCSVLGPDVLLWGTSVMVKTPGQKHRWHVDLEHRRWTGVSVFIGLTGASKLASLKVVSGSHQHDCGSTFFEKMPKDRSVLKKAREYSSHCRIDTVDIQPGEFFLFDGKLWHGSENKSNRTRYAIIAQYTTPHFPIKVPLNWNEPIRWANASPPCIVVAGKDESNLNRLV